MVRVCDGSRGETHHNTATQNWDVPVSRRSPDQPGANTPDALRHTSAPRPGTTLPKWSTRFETPPLARPRGGGGRGAHLSRARAGCSIRRMASSAAASVSCDRMWCRLPVPAHPPILNLKVCGDGSVNDDARVGGRLTARRRRHAPRATRGDNTMMIGACSVLCRRVHLNPTPAHYRRVGVRGSPAKRVLNV